MGTVYARPSRLFQRNSRDDRESFFNQVGPGAHIIYWIYRKNIHTLLIPIEITPLYSRVTRCRWDSRITLASPSHRVIIFFTKAPHSVFSLYSHWLICTTEPPLFQSPGIFSRMLPVMTVVALYLSFLQRTPLSLQHTRLSSTASELARSFETLIAMGPVKRF